MIKMLPIILALILVVMIAPISDARPKDVTVQTLGFSAGKRPVELYRFRDFPKPVLFIGGIHGDEAAGVELMKMLIRDMESNFLKTGRCSVAIIPQANPDGIANNTRGNGRMVDINRNFKTKNWSPVRSGKRYSPGNEAGSEAETRFIMDTISHLKPFRIVVIHTPLRVINFDGPAQKLAVEMNRHLKYKLMEYIGYPTPGSIGTFSGVERNIPTITLELPAQPSQAEMTDVIKALDVAVKFDNNCD